MGWLIAVTILALLGALPLGVYAEYKAECFGLYVLLGAFRIRVGKAEPKSKTAKKNSNTSSFASHETKEKTAKKKYTQYASLIRPVLRFLSDFKKKLRVNDLQLKVILAGEDPCDLSIHYGRVWMALGNIVPQLDRWFLIKKRNMDIRCDYLGDRTTVDFSIHLTITLFWFLQVIGYHGITLLREYFKILKNAKDGAVI